MGVSGGRGRNSIGSKGGGDFSQACGLPLVGVVRLGGDPIGVVMGVASARWGRDLYGPNPGGGVWPVSCGCGLTYGVGGL